jgi:hypothetical protein
MASQRMGQRGHHRTRSNGVDFFLDLALRDPAPLFEGVEDDEFGGL